MIVEHRDYEIVAGKSLYGFDCKVYPKGQRRLRKGLKPGFKGRPVMDDLYVKTIAEAKREIDKELYGGQTSIDDFKGDDNE